MSQGPEINALVPWMDSAEEDEALSEAGRKLLEDPARQEMIALTSGTPIDEEPGDVTLLALVVDDSGSMSRHANAVRRGHERFIKRLRLGVPDPKAVFVTTQLLNGAGLISDRSKGDPRIINPWRPLAFDPNATQEREATTTGVVALNETNYIPNGGTPLFPRIIDVVGSLVTKAAEGKERWKSVRTFMVVLTDGGDTSSNRDGSRMEPETVAEVIVPFVNSGRSIVATVGFGSEETFTPIFTRMGVDPKWQLTVDSTDEQIDRVLGLITSAATGGATSDEDFDKTRKGGFLALTSGN